MNPIPLTVFATLAGLSLASLALIQRNQKKDTVAPEEEQGKTKKATKFSELEGIKKAIGYLFMSFVSSILGLVIGAVLGNIGQFSFISANIKNGVHIADNISAFTLLCFSSAYIYGGAGFLVTVIWGDRRGTIVQYWAEKAKLGWIIKKIIIPILETVGDVFTKGFFNETENKPDKKTENKQKADTSV